MRLFPRLSALLMLSAMVASCGWMKPRDNDDYRESRAGRPLTIPEGLDTPPDSAALVIPAKGEGRNETDVSDAPPAVAINNEPIVPVGSLLSPDEAYAKVEAGLRATSGFTVKNADADARTLEVTTVVAKARSTWWSRFSGRDAVERTGETRKVGVLAASGGHSSVAIQDVRGKDDAAARRILTAIRQALR